MDLAYPHGEWALDTMWLMADRQQLSLAIKSSLCSHENSAGFSQHMHPGVLVVPPSSTSLTVPGAQYACQQLLEEGLGSALCTSQGPYAVLSAELCSTERPVNSAQIFTFLKDMSLCVQV